MNKSVLPFSLGATTLAVALAAQPEVDGLAESNMPLPAATEIADLRDAFVYQCEEQSRRDIESPVNVVLATIATRRTELAEQVGCTDNSVWTCGTPGTPAPHPEVAQGIPSLETSFDCPEEDPFNHYADLVRTQ